LGAVECNSSCGTLTTSYRCAQIAAQLDSDAPNSPITWQLYIQI
jgi:hypothetical protein